MQRVGLPAIGLIFLMIFSLPVSAQTAPGSPAEVVTDFYRLLREKRYVEGFRLSVYESAVVNLLPSELEELRPDFDTTFAQIPPGVTIRGEQVSGETAVVWLELAGKLMPDPVILIRVGGQWRVGDQETYNMVRQEGRQFFFNARMFVNERETADLLKQLVFAQIMFAQNNNGRFASLPELVAQNKQDLPQELFQGVANGYRIELHTNGKGFNYTAVPVQYGRTGKLSFFANAAGVRAQDLKGQSATVMAPVFQY